MAKVTFTTPVGAARYPKISSPDTTGEYADNKFKTDVVFSDADFKDLKAKITEFAKAELPGVKSPKLPLGEHKDKETGEVTSFVRFKSARKPIIVDAKRNRIPDDVQIGGGSKIRVGGTLASYMGKGITIYLNAVQVVELQQGFNINDFEEVEDGFEVEAAGDDAKSEFDL
jgi:hypothetical protein